MVDKGRRYVVMPRLGVVGETMQSALSEEAPEPHSFFRGLAERLTPLLSDGLFARALDEGPPAPVAVAEPPTAKPDFALIAQRFSDGPALVSLTDQGRVAFEAENPELRCVPVTEYGLPSRVPRGRRATVAAGVQAAGAASVTQSARDGGGLVWDKDFKAVLAAAAGGSRLGEGVNVGVLDTGVDAKHPALADAVAVSRCLIAGAEAGAGRPVDWGPAAAARAAHGTHVAGIIAARPGGQGPEGVAPRSSILSYRIFPDNAKGEAGAENIDIINAMISALRDGCHIINLSLEGAKLREDGVRSAIASAWSQGVICIAAAGNGFGGPVSYPAAHANCVAVTALGRVGSYPDKPEFNRYLSTDIAASDANIYLARFSNFGPQVQFAAPGHGIVSTFPNGEWWFDSGTSMAAPFVSGMLARLLSDAPDVLAAPPDEKRSAAMLKLLIDRAQLLRLPQRAQEGHGAPH